MRKELAPASALAAERDASADEPWRIRTRATGGCAGDPKPPSHPTESGCDVLEPGQAKGRDRAIARRRERLGCAALAPLAAVPIEGPVAHVVATVATASVRALRAKGARRCRGSWSVAPRPAGDRAPARGLLRSMMFTAPLAATCPSIPLSQGPPICRTSIFPGRVIHNRGELVLGTVTPRAGP